MNITLDTRDNHTLSAYRAGPDDAKRGLVVVQEIFGVNSHMRAVADRFAAEGYAVIAPALFDRVGKDIELGYTDEDVKKGLELRAGIPLEQSLDDIAAAIQALGQRAIGIVGYCWGGTLAWQAATSLDGLRAASCWYGGGIAQAKDQTPRVPVQMHFGETDASIPMSDVEAVRQAQPGVEIYTYAGAGHGFGCDQRGSFEAEAAALAQQRTLAFFAQHLGGASA